MVESLEIEVPFVRTDDNPADFFTKPYPNNAKKFHAFRRVLMNERGDLADSASRQRTAVRGGAPASGDGSDSQYL